MATNKELILAGIVARLGDVMSFDAPAPFALINFDRIRANLADYQDHELPAAQIIDIGAAPIAIERPRMKTAWSVAIEIAMRPIVGLAVTQATLWQMEEAVIQAIMNKPQLDVVLPHIGAMIHVLPADRATDLHTFAPTYVATVSFQVLYYEPMTRRTC